MAQGKKSFVIYTGWKSFLDDLSDAQLGQWLRWVLDYTNDTNPPFPDDQAIRLACKMAMETLKRDLKKYEEKVERIKSARNQNPNNNKELNENSNQTEIKLKSVKTKTEISSVNVNVNDNVNVNVNDNVLSNDNIKEYKLSNDNILSQTLRYWNDKSKQYRTEKFKMPTHKAITPSMEKAINKALSLYGWNDITLAIERYAVIGNDESYYFNYVWTLEEFLKQSNALPEFLDNGSKWLNYCSSKSGIKKQEENILNSISDEEFWRVWRGEK